VSQNRLVINGLDELRQALRELPHELAAEASHIVTGAANGAAADIKAAYPVRTGNLRDHLSVESFPASGAGAKAVVKNTARHAVLFENGTQARHTKIGANRGAMPPGHVFVPRVIKARRRMYQELADLLRRQGLQVSGDVG
jgi:Bacteriophage HK97-gp10, putative tail-component